jgi:DNA phosphorothioation-dependent restriction protein DptH
VADLRGQNPQYRAVFSGPPDSLLREVFDSLVVDTGFIEAPLANGTLVKIPVLLQVGELYSGTTNPAVGKSGPCDGNHLMDLRNSPGCPIYVGLVPASDHSNLSKRSTWSDFGLSTESSAATSTIEQWWEDPFIQALVSQMLDRHSWPTTEALNGARRLVEYSVQFADEVERHDVSRLKAWDVLSRVSSITDARLPFGTSVSLATGFPPLADGTTDADESRPIRQRRWSS